MIVLVCGGRDFFGDIIIRKTLMDLIDRRDLFADVTETVMEIVHGGQRGADQTAGDVARKLGLKVSEYPVTKDEWKKYGLGAGPMRNGRMLREKKPQLVIAFPGGKGTANMVKQADEAGIKVYHVAPF
jgi:hypothetical protein